MNQGLSQVFTKGRGQQIVVDPRRQGRSQTLQTAVGCTKTALGDNLSTNVDSNIPTDRYLRSIIIHTHDQAPF